MTNTHDAKVMADGAAVVVGVGGFMQWFPPIVGLVGGILDRKSTRLNSSHT